MDAEIIILFISSVVFLIGVFSWVRNSRLLLRGENATGTIIKNVEARNTSTIIWYPVISFRNESDELLTRKLSIGFSPPKELGSKIEIVYNPHDDSEIGINSKFLLVVFPRLMTAIGLTGLIASFIDIFEVANVFP